MSGQQPVTAEEWQAAVDAAHWWLLVDSARKYGLVEGGPDVDVERCEEILAGRRTPSRLRAGRTGRWCVMSADLTAAHEALREILAGLDASVAHLREIADGLRDKPESELPSEPEDGTRWLDADGCIWSRHDDRVGLHDLHRWRSDSVVGLFAWWGVLKCAAQPLVQLVRADQTVVLPSVVPPAGAVVEAKTSARQLTAWLAYDETCVKFEIRNTDEHACWQILLAGDDAERWLLDVLALVRSKGGAR